jgi:acyl-CoA synthetase (AMP-forming)/AMP-acid ligase II
MVVDADGAELASDEEGELWVRSPGNMLGYYRDEAATAAAMHAGGWFASGDIASLDGDGNLYILGRLKELIIRSGFNVYPAEIENVLNDDIAVAASAVIGVPDGENEAIVAYVQPTVGMLVDTDRLTATLRERLSPYKQPREIRILEQLPQTSTGKVLKARLK